MYYIQFFIYFYSEIFFLVIKNNLENFVKFIYQNLHIKKPLTSK